MDRDWDQSMNRPPVKDEPWPPLGETPRVLLPLLLWSLWFILGVAGALGDYGNAASLVAFVLAELAIVGVLTSLVVWLWLPRPSNWQQVPALAWLGILLGAHLLMWAPLFMYGVAVATAHPGIVAVVFFALIELGAGAVLVTVLVRPRLPIPPNWQSESARALLGVLLGALLGAAGAFFYVMGIFLPYKAGWGDLKLEDFGGWDTTWHDWLATLHAFFFVVGALTCGASGFIAWALRFLRPDQRTKAGQA